ncbi:sodium:calcium antiporter [Roseibium sp. Sym1]|uniref:sodium:calcium antiporter n=1 Tax=Roseibium sp. Sym1 TaxID=3016006 RepID=UPI0022B4AB65|nr:sodium:calcium antiporter [Roseibium sp. Sym1]
MQFGDLPGWTLLTMFVGAGLVIFLAGVRMTHLADRIADRTGFGEALVGGVLLGAATSLSGTVVSVTAALDGRTSLAFSNAVGGIAAQTAFLAIADVIYRRANLEHVAADLASVFQSALLLLMLSIPVVAYTGPDISLLGVHPASLVLVGVYIAGLFALREVRDQPMWRVVDTFETRPDEPDEDQGDTRSNLGLLLSFAALMIVLGLMGWTISRVAGELTDRYGLSASLVGALLTAVVTSLPELVTTLAAVHRGALQLAVGGIIGGNTFDTLFLTLSDIAYREGSLYHAVSGADFFWLAVGLVMTSILLLGLVVRQKDGPARIGFESASILAVYAGAVALQVLT